MPAIRASACSVRAPSEIGINLNPGCVSTDVHHVTVRHPLGNRVNSSGVNHGYAFAANGKVGNMTQITARDNRGSRLEASIFAKSGYTHRDIALVRNRSSVWTTARLRHQSNERPLIERELYRRLYGLHRNGSRGAMPSWSQPVRRDR